MGAISLTLPDAVAARPQSIVETTGRSESLLMIEALREHLDDLHLAEQRYEDYLAGGSRTFTLAEVIRDLGLTD